MRETKGKQLEKQDLGGLRGSDGLRNLIDPDRGPFAKTATPEALLHPISKIGSDPLPTGGAVGANGPRSRPGPFPSTPVGNAHGVDGGEGRGCLVNTRITPRREGVKTLKGRKPDRKKGRFKSVIACETGAWSILSWKVKDPSRKHLRPFKCGSWRHEGKCRERAGARDFVRCRDGIESRDAWIYIVLTFDPKQWEGSFHAYKHGGKLWNRLNSRLTRRYGKIDYVQTWEATQKGWPHVNIVLHNDEILQRCAGEGWRDWRQELRVMASEVGFGEVLWVEPVRDKTEMAGYITKLSRELTGASRKDQVPVNAPAHFRRLRASRGLLPPVHSHTGIWTGAMVMKSVAEIRKMERVWGLDVEVLVNPHLWTLIRSLDDGELIEEIEVEVENLENIILEKMVQETRAG